VSRLLKMCQYPSSLRKRTFVAFNMAQAFPLSLATLLPSGILARRTSTGIIPRKQSEIWLLPIVLGISRY
jgi:hypothetical protein